MGDPIIEDYGDGYYIICPVCRCQYRVPFYRQKEMNRIKDFVCVECGYKGAVRW